jgi:sec-independent protein translocase protein TatC
MSTFYAMIFMMGLVFELPLLAWLLSKLGLITKETLKTYRRHAVIVLLILSALITPTGDPLTLALVFTPLYLLYELSIYVVRPSQKEV